MYVNEPVSVTSFVSTAFFDESKKVSLRSTSFLRLTQDTTDLAMDRHDVRSLLLSVKLFQSESVAISIIEIQVLT